MGIWCVWCGVFGVRCWHWYKYVWCESACCKCFACKHCCHVISFRSECRHCSVCPHSIPWMMQGGVGNNWCEQLWCRDSVVASILFVSCCCTHIVCLLLRCCQLIVIVIIVTYTSFFNRPRNIERSSAEFAMKA